MLKHDIDKRAEFLSGLFEYTDTVYDGIFGYEERRFFYLLEDSGYLLSYTEELEQTLSEKPVKVSYWVLNMPKIRRALSEPAPKNKIAQMLEAPDPNNPEEIYSALPENVWVGKN